MVSASNSRVRAAEDEKGAAHRDGRRLILHREIRQPLRTGPRWDFWEVVIIVIIVTH